MSQLGLDVTGHNIANVDTRGYTRQRIVSTAYDPFSTIGRALSVEQARVGGGVNEKVHDQIRSAYLDRRYRTENTINAYWQKRTESLSYLESYFDNVNEETSINYSISRFFQAMKTLAEDTVEGAPRTLLQTAGKDLVQQINTIYDGLIDLQETQNQSVAVIVTEINRIADEIAQLNKAIYGFEISGHMANDLRDKRNVLIDDLSTLVDVEYRDYPDGKGYSKLEVTIGGRKLVDHVDTWKLDVREVANPIPELAAANKAPVWEVFWEGDAGPWGAQLSGGGRTVNLEFIGVDPNAASGDPTSIESVRAEAAAIIDAIMGGAATASDIARLKEIVKGVDDSSGVAIGGIQIAAGASEPGTSLTMEPVPQKYFLKGGELKAYIDMRDGNGVGSNPRGIPYYIEMLNNLARALVMEINAVHREGYNDHPVNGSENGIDFFWAKDASGAYYSVDLNDPANLNLVTARNICLSELVEGNAYNIACSSKMIVKQVGGPHELQRGNNENMNAMYALFLKKDISLGSLLSGGVSIGSFDGYATSIRFDVGNTLNNAKKTGENSNTLTVAADNQRLAVAGVSLDEEMTNLIRYQHAYNGAARVITTMDDALDRLINGTGRVGL